jgi:hypothetical protein
VHVGLAWPCWMHTWVLPNDQAQEGNINANACWHLGCFVKCMSDLLWMWRLRRSQQSTFSSWSQIM